MRDRLRGAGVAFALATIVSTAAPAFAQDVVVMPFRCAVVDGNPVLTPADDQGHRVIGAREQRKVKTCSTVDPKNCRQWTTFKFDMDCGGARVPWMQVFANASEFTRRRVWERDGRLRVQDTPQRSRRIDDMCARRMGTNMEWSSVNEICDQVSPLNVPTATDMPAGFAPMVGLDAILMPLKAIDPRAVRVAKSAPVETATVSGKATEAERPVDRVAVAEPVRVKDTARNDVQPSVKAKASLKPIVPAKPDDALATLARDTGTTEEPTSRAGDETPTVAVPKNALTTQEQVSAVKPRAPRVETAQAEPVASPEFRMAREPVAEVVAQAQPANATIVRSDAQPQAPAPVTETATIQSSVDAAAGADRSLAYIIVVLASLLLTATVLMVKWLGRAKANEPGIAPVMPNLDSRETPPSNGNRGPADPVTSEAFAVELGARRSRGTDLIAVPVHHARSTDLRAVSRRASRAVIQDRMPSSKGEALEVLGMGVASDGNLSSLKKIIDGLRMNWHPDLARDEADRRIREIRLKQINAAWEILGEKAVEA